MKNFCLLLAAGIFWMSGAASAYSDGTLLKEKNGTSVYEIKNGRKIPVPDTSVIGRRQVIEVSPAEFSQIPDMPRDSYKSMSAQLHGTVSNGQAAKSYAPSGNAAIGTMPNMEIGGVTTPVTSPSLTPNPTTPIQANNHASPISNAPIPAAQVQTNNLVINKPKPTSPIGVGQEALPYAELSGAIYEHKVESDNNKVKPVGNWERIVSTRASFKEARDKAATAALVEKLSRDGSLSAEDFRQIQRNDDKLDSDIVSVLASKDPISFHAEVYKNKDGKRVIVFEGTGGRQDWIADFAQPFTVPAQYKAALEFTKKVIEGCSKDQGCNKNDIVVTGHSLGGGLAQYVSMMVDTDVKAYTFNPAGLWGPTTKSIDTAKAKNITNFIADGYVVTADGNNKIVGSDPVSKTGVVFGSEVGIPVNLTGLWHEPKNGQKIASLGENIDNSKNLHSMPHLIAGMSTPVTAASVQPPVVASTQQPNQVKANIETAKPVQKVEFTAQPMAPISRATEASLKPSVHPPAYATPAQKAPMSGGATANMMAANDAWNDCARRLGPSFSQKLSAATSSKDAFIRANKEVFDELERNCGKQIPDGVKQQILASMQNYVPPAQNPTAPVQANNQAVIRSDISALAARQAAVQPQTLTTASPTNIRPNALLPVAAAQAQQVIPQQSPQTPQIQAISPATIVGSNALQPIMLTGSNFQRGMKVTVGYSGGRVTLQDAHVEVLGPNQARISINTQTTPDNWTVQVANPNGLPSNVSAFRVVAPVVATASAQPIVPQLQPQIQASKPNQVVASNNPQTPVLAPALQFNGFASNYSATSTPYAQSISLTGAGFNSVTQISWSCTQPNGMNCPGSPYVWTPSNWNGKFTRYSDTAASVSPSLLLTGDPAGTYRWTATFHGAGQPVVWAFTVTNNTPSIQAVNPTQRAAAPVVAMAPVQQPAQTIAQPPPPIQPPPASIRPTVPLPVAAAQAQPMAPQPPPQVPQKAPAPAPALQFNGFASSYSTTSTPYQPTISLSGSSFNSITQINWTCAMPNGASCGAIPPWTSANWNGKFIRYSDTSAVVAPMLLVATDPKGIYHWTATFYGAGQPVTRSFAVTKN